MDPSAIAGLCALLSRSPAGSEHAARAGCPPAAYAPQAIQGITDLQDLLSAPDAREAVARVSFAEAANQGDSGLAGVVYTILNRLVDGRWGRSVEAVVNARGQFEPVMRAGGDWRRLPAVSAAQKARIDTILNLALEGRLPDLTNGARFFQNPAIVAGRARSGQVSQRLVAFGGATPSAVIGAHHFYVSQGRGGGRSSGRRSGSSEGRPTPISSNLFVGDNRAQHGPGDGGPAAWGPASVDPSHALFVGADGRVANDQP